MRYLATVGLALVLALGFAAPAPAQDQPKQPWDAITVRALQTDILLKAQQLKAMAEHAQRRENDWAEYSKPLWAPAPAEPAAK